METIKAEFEQRGKQKRLMNKEAVLAEMRKLKKLNRNNKQITDALGLEYKYGWKLIQEAMAPVIEREEKAKTETSESKAEAAVIAEPAEVTELTEEIDYSIKADEGKPRLFLVPPGIIEAIGAIRTYGVHKYGDAENWRSVEPERYQDALVRHLCKYMRNPKGVDEESGYSHLWHMACNIAFLVELEAEE